MNADISSLTKYLNLRTIARYRGLIVTLVVIGLVGFTAYQISLITSVQPDQPYLAAQKDGGGTKLKLTPQIIENLQQLQPAGTGDVQIRPGKNNPFSL